MKLTTRNVKLAWKYRRILWKYRNLIRHRRQIAGIALFGAMVGAGVVIRRATRPA